MEVTQVVEAASNLEKLGIIGVLVVVLMIVGYVASQLWKATQKSDKIAEEYTKTTAEMSNSIKELNNTLRQQSVLSENQMKFMQEIVQLHRDDLTFERNRHSDCKDKFYQLQLDIRDKLDLMLRCEIKD